MQRIAKEPADAVDPALLQDNEKAFSNITGTSANAVRDLLARQSFDEAMTEVLSWIPTITSYFEAVLVNDNDTRTRQNRHALVKSVLDSLQLVADFTRIEKK